MKSSLVFSLLCVFSVAACAPKIYVIDRQTVLEQESAGDWPKFEDDLMGKAMAQGPTPFTTVPMTASKARLYHVLNGELVAAPDPSQHGGRQ